MRKSLSERKSTDRRESYLFGLYYGIHKNIWGAFLSIHRHRRAFTFPLRCTFKEHSTYSSVQLLKMLIKAFLFKIERIQTDIGMGFIKSFDECKKGNLSLFEVRLKELGSVTSSFVLTRQDIGTLSPFPFL